MNLEDLHDIERLAILAGTGIRGGILDEGQTALTLMLPGPPDVSTGAALN
jgi:hypothetical protein